MSPKTWSGRAVQEARAYMVHKLPAPCGQCGETVTRADRWVVGHTKSRAEYPELTFIVANWRVEHRACSDASAQSIVQANAARAALAAAGVEPFSPDGPPRTPPPLPGSPSLGLRAQNEPLEVPDRLIWSKDTLAPYAWLSDLLEAPEDAAPPLAMTPPHPDATGSYGAEACQWIEESQGITLRWWQRLAITRQLEHDAAGRLLWRIVVESAPRRAGKSVRLRGLALWRLEHGTRLFGETQLVIHTGKDVSIVREIQMKAWRWAEDTAGWTVTRANGKEAMETPSGDRWLARAMHSVYGYDVCLGMVDEAWAVDPGALDEGLEPATMERLSPQVHLTSTAHRRATSLMRRRIGEALAADDGETLLLLWAAPPGSDPSKPETWRAASPHWSEDRRRVIEGKYERALSGEVDPEADDLDPMAGFEAQYLNRWILKPVKSVAGSPVVTDTAWETLYADLPDAAPESVAVEGWPGEGISVARAWRLGPELVGVTVEDVPDVESAAILVRAYGCRRRPIVGASLIGDPAWGAAPVQSKTDNIRTSVADLARLVADDQLRHDGGEHLTGQAVGLRVSPAADGLRLRSTGRADAVKAAVWAAQAIRLRSAGRPRILTARAS